MLLMVGVSGLLVFCPPWSNYDSTVTLDLCSNESGTAEASQIIWICVPIRSAWLKHPKY